MGNGLTSSIQTSTDYTPAAVGNTSALWLLGGVKWGGAVGTGVKLTYSFGSANSAYDGYTSDAEPYVGYSVMNATQKAAALAAMKGYGDVAMVTFSPVTDTATSAGDIRWANSTSDPTSYAWAYFPGSDPVSGDVWNNPDITTTLVNETFYVLAHEFGHALGLSHPHAEPDRLTPAGPSARDSVKYTLMSYNDYAGDPDINDESDYYPTTLMMDDIRTVQALYGKNLAYRADNTIYQWKAGNVIYETIWDGSGTDTLNASNQLAAVSLNLNPGTFSTIGKAFFNGQSTVRDCLGIAYGCNIENATGSAYNDTLLGNALANNLAGGAGNDIVRGAAGNDALYGDNGVDQLYGGLGTDLIYGGTGNDKLYGEDGNDKLYGETGLDALSGGLGNDVFIFNTSLSATTNVDTIADFSRVAGNTDKIWLDDDIFIGLGVVTQTTTLGTGAFCAGTVATSASQHIVYDRTTGNLFYDADGAGGVAQVKIAVIGVGGMALNASDFAVVA